MNVESSGIALNSSTSPQLLENQEGTGVTNVTDYGSGDATFFGNETSSRDEDTSAEGFVESVNASRPASNSAASGDGSALTEVKIQRYEVDDNKGLHVIYPVAAMSPGTYYLEIDYETPPDGKAIYSESYGEPGESGK